MHQPLGTSCAPQETCTFDMVVDVPTQNSDPGSTGWCQRVGDQHTSAARRNESWTGIEAGTLHYQAPWPFIPAAEMPARPVTKLNDNACKLLAISRYPWMGALSQWHSIPWSYTERQPGPVRRLSMASGRNRSSRKCLHQLSGPGNQHANAREQVKKQSQSMGALCDSITCTGVTVWLVFS